LQSSQFGHTPHAAADGIFMGTFEGGAMKKSLHFTLAALGCAALAACSTDRSVSVYAPAAAPPATVVAAPPATVAVMGAPAAPFNAYDRDFVYTAVGANMMEVGASQMAPKRTNNAEVQSLASMINRDHTQALNELTAMMRARGMGVPNELPPDKRDLMNKLGTSRGGDFDEKFVMDVGVRAHQADIAAFQQHLPRLADPELRAWVERQLPPMQQHLAMAQQMAGRVG
jgi:putative membrane protein